MSNLENEWMTVYRVTVTDSKKVEAHQQISDVGFTSPRNAADAVKLVRPMCTKSITWQVWTYKIDTFGRQRTTRTLLADGNHHRWTSSPYAPEWLSL